MDAPTALSPALYALQQFFAHQQVSMPFKLYLTRPLTLLLNNYIKLNHEEPRLLISIQWVLDALLARSIEYKDSSSEEGAGEGVKCVRGWIGRGYS